MSWLRKLRCRIRNWLTPPYELAVVEHLPDEPQPKTLYLIGIEQPWQAAMICPCGCQRLIQLSLIPKDKPSWSSRIHENGKVSLFPSVWRQKGCGSHFVVSHGRIYWC